MKYEFSAFEMRLKGIEPTLRNQLGLVLHQEYVYERKRLNPLRYLFAKHGVRRDFKLPPPKPYG
jgi:hypothetical protein